MLLKNSPKKASIQSVLDSAVPIIHTAVNMKKICLLASEDVGFLRDICVDIIARNFYNEFDYRVSYLCEQLGKV